jgi:2-polyprenyl-6-hydroxyphenyl methylase/3-demethylubiquinone-9 3-methyltransferase
MRTAGADKCRRAPIGEAMLSYEALGEEFDRVMNRYDLERRLEIVFGVLLRPDQLRGRKLLDAGCGTGHFSRRASELGARVVCVDIGRRLVRRAVARREARGVCADVATLPFATGSFDAVVCSEVIEHTPRPARAFAELCRVLRPGGVLALTTPNLPWYPSVVLANWLKVRPYHGLENWVSRARLLRWCGLLKMRCERMVGFHLLPFQWPRLHPFLRWCDRRAQFLAPLMINVGLLAVREAPDMAQPKETAR